MAREARANDSNPGGVSRRRFVYGTVKAGTAVGATIWVAPRLSSVALAQDSAGSPAPTTTSTTNPPAEPPVVGPEVRPVPDVRSAAGVRVGAAPIGAATEGQDVPTVGGLALTGSDIRSLALAGSTAVIAGEGLLILRRNLARPQLAIAAPDSSGAPTKDRPGTPSPHDAGGATAGS